MTEAGLGASTQMHLQQEARSFECVEIYIPKKLEHLSELFTFLRNKLSQRGQEGESAVGIDGFSLYEVDGAFIGDQIYEERTVVIRILLHRGAGDEAGGVRERIETLGREVAATVALTEREVWICHYPQGVVIFRAASG
jgi:hypothetical protein